nr:hypothetical protein [Tanacetum cinerariifolium]
MQGWDNKSLGELHAMLTTAKNNMSLRSVFPSLHMITDGGMKKKSWKKRKGNKERKKVPPPSKKENMVNDAECFRCRKIGQCGIHVYNNVQGMISSIRLEKGVMMLHMGYGNLAKVVAIGSYFLNVPSGLELYLEQCHYSPSLEGDDIEPFIPFYRTGNRAKDMIGLINSDVCGPLSVPTRDGDTYFVTFTASPINVVVQAPPKSQENDVAPGAPFLRRLGRTSHPPKTYYGYLIDSEARGLRD